MEQEGFSIMGFLLQKLSSHLSNQCVGSIEKLLRSVENSGIKKKIFYSKKFNFFSIPLLTAAAVKDIYKYLLFNFWIWVATPFAVQKQLCNLLLKQVEKDPTV
jgi:hypothetical protein